MNSMSLIFAFGLIAFTGVVQSTPVTPLYLRIDLPTTSTINPSYSSSSSIKVLNVAGIQIYGTNCPSGCIRQTGTYSVTHTLGSTFYSLGNGAVNCTMSSYMTYAHDVLDKTAPNLNRNASYCIDALDSTFCATDYADPAPSITVDLSQLGYSYSDFTSIEVTNRVDTATNGYYPNQPLYAVNYQSRLVGARLTLFSGSSTFFTGYFGSTPTSNTNNVQKYTFSTAPTSQPTSRPSMQPTGQPTSQPTRQPTGQPTGQPTCQPTGQPTRQPTGQPTGQPTRRPSGQPTTQPTRQPTGQPTRRPSGQPTRQPTGQPTMQPTKTPTGQPTGQPTSQPISQPTRSPSGQPTGQPTRQPTSQPTGQPTSQPIGRPSRRPSGQPTSQPTGQPTRQPTGQPTVQPSRQPTRQPTTQPSSRPSSQPTSQPTVQPSGQPTSMPSTKSIPAQENKLIIGVVVLTCGLIAAMAVIFVCAFKYPGDHITCEHFLSTYLCYSPFGASIEHTNAANPAKA